MRQSHAIMETILEVHSSDIRLEIPIRMSQLFA